LILMDLPGEKNGTLEAGDGREQGRRPSFIYLCMCLVSYLLGSLCGTEGRLGLLPRYMYDTRAGLLTSGSPGEIGMQAGDSLYRHTTAVTTCRQESECHWCELTSWFSTSHGETGMPHQLHSFHCKPAAAGATFLACIGRPREE